MEDFVPKSAYPVAAIPWSAIRRIGQSRLLALTIVVPFIGSLLLFNQHVIELLTFSPELVRRWLKVPAEASNDIARQITLTRLYYVYFGLTFLGLGSALYTLLCPLIVKSYASAIEYVQVEAPLVTPSGMKLIVSEAAQHYSSWWDNGDDYNDMPAILRRWGTPNDFLNLGSVAIVEIFNDTAPAENPPEERTSRTDDEDASNDPFNDHRGRPEPTKNRYRASFGNASVSGIFGGIR